MATQINIPYHKDIARNKAKYERIRVLLDSDEAQYGNDIFCPKLPNEPRNAREIRKKLYIPAFRNLAHDLLGAPRDTIFRENIRLEFGEESATNVLSQWAKDVSRDFEEMPLLHFVRDVCAITLRAYGTVWVVGDKPSYDAANLEDEMTNGRLYLTNISPGNVINYERDESGFVWFAYRRDFTQSWADPTQEAPQPKKQVCILTRKELIVTEQGKEVDRVPHALGMCPVVSQALFIPPDSQSIIGVTPFFASSNLIIMGNTMKSIADMEIAKHGNSLLLMHEQSIGSMNTQVDAKGNPQIKIQDPAYNQLVWHGEHPPEYLTKDLASVTTAHDRAEYYFSAAVENERSMRSVMKKGADGQDLQESGVSKSFDMDPVLAGLKTTSQCLESLTWKIIEMAATVYGVDTEAQKVICEFPKRFDIAQKAFTDRLEEIKAAQEVRYPSKEGQRIMWKGLTPEITQDKEEQEAINDEIDALPLEDPEEELRNEVANELNMGNQKMRAMIKRKGMTDEEIDAEMKMEEVAK